MMMNVKLYFMLIFIIVISLKRFHVLMHSCELHEVKFVMNRSKLHF
ncbi:hypothetical protein KSF78_0008310 [Schistosoma japonicum]|nr:hypothetical protein KSF78_0008310 [Schistosoma japonicum]